MQIIKAKLRIMSFFGQKEDNLPEIIADKAFISISGKTSERESDQLLKQEEILLFVVVEFMERIKFIRCGF